MKSGKVLAILLVIAALIVVTVIVLKPKSMKPVAVDQSILNPALENIFQRKSVRTYSDRKVSHEQLEMLAKAGMAAPTAMNKQPWEFIIVESREALDSLAKSLPYAKMLESASAAIIVCGDNGEPLTEANQAGWWVQDCSAASENILLAAESMGLGAVWTGVYPDMGRVNIVRNALSIPSHIVPLNVIPVGYPLNKETPKDKYKSEKIHWDKF